MSKLFLTAVVAALTFASSQPAQADTLRNGFSVERLGRVDALLDGYVNEGRIAGIVALVLRDGKPVYQKVVGWADKEANRKMALDTEFRIASQTKALTSAAIGEAEVTSTPCGHNWRRPRLPPRYNYLTKTP